MIVNQERCTLCLSCVGVCPTRALNDNPERPQLGFTEVNCVQCGLCRATCPEDAITLEPRLNFARAAKEKIVLKEEEPFGCIRCGKPFATQSTIDLLVKKLEGHSMFSEPGRLDIIKMCEDCRVIVQFERTDDPFAGRRPAGAADHRRLPARTRGRPGPSPLQGQAALTMPDFWKLSGYHLLERDRAGALRVTDAFLRAYLERPEIRPIAESCAAEIALFERLMAEPRMPVPDQDLSAFADPDAAENYGVFLRFRDWLAGAPSLEAAYLRLVRGGGGIPPLFVDHIVQVILRGILEDCDDPLRLRAAELLFRSQKVNIADGAIMLADDETVETQAASAAINLDVLSEDNIATYWERSDRYDTVFNASIQSFGQDALARVLESWVDHFLGVRVSIQPVASIRDERWRWHVGLGRGSHGHPQRPVRGARRGRGPILADPGAVSPGVQGSRRRVARHGGPAGLPGHGDDARQPPSPQTAKSFGQFAHRREGMRDRNDHP